MALIRLCNFGKSYWLMLCTSQRCWHWSISWLILTWWAIYWQADKPFDWGGNEAGVLQHSAPSLAFFHSNNDLCCVNLLRTSLTASYDWSEPGLPHRMPPCEGLLDPVYCTAILWTLALVKYHHAYSYRCDLYPTTICANPYHSLTSPTHDWTLADRPYCGLGHCDLSRCSLAEYKYSYYYYVKDTYHYHCHCSHR